MKASITNKNFQTSLKPYSLYFFRLSNIYLDYSNIQEYQDLKDLKNASIKKLRIANVSIKNKSRLVLTELLRNNNIKKIVFILEDASIDFLLFISKLIEKNITIKEIELITEFSSTSRKEFLYNAWLYFIDTISSRLVKLEIRHKNNSHDFHCKLDGILLRNPKLNEIKIFNIGNDDIYAENIKEVLSSKNYLDDFIIDAKRTFNNEFYHTLSKMKTKAEIDTLHIGSYHSPDGTLATIENAYLFNVKTIRISNISKLTVFNTIFKLSNNPHNTVKRIIIEKSEKNLEEIILDLKSFDLKDYNLKKLPKIFLNRYQELIIDEVNNEHRFLKIRGYTEYASSCLFLKRNSIEVNNLTELLNKLFNSNGYFEGMTLTVYYENNMILKNTNPQYLVENRKSIILGMMEIYDKFKVDNIQSKRNTIEEIRFMFKKNFPELNFVYFTVLEIIVLTKIEIQLLSLDHCPISELVEFLEKHKSLDSLNINKIFIFNCETIDKENINKLYQYSHLIENKIFIDFDNEYIDIEKESVQIELIDIFHSRSRNYNNFVALWEESFPFMTETLDFTRNNLSDYVSKINTLESELKSYNDIYFSKHIIKLPIDFDLYELNSFSNQFSFLKEYEYDLRSVSFKKSEKSSISNRLKMFFMIFETICNSKYRRSKVNLFQYEIEGTEYSKKCKRYLKIHNIVLK